MFYPNPVIDKLNIEIDSKVDGAKVEFNLYDITGKLVDSQILSDTQPLGIQTYEIQSDALIEGVYNVKLIVGDQVIDKKVIKLRD